MEKKNYFVAGMATVFVIGLITAIFFASGCAASNAAAPSDPDAGAPETASAAINVVSREDGSGTRSAFVELFEVIDANENDATTSSAIITNSTSVGLTTVSGDPAAIGYISLGSLNDTVKALDIDGVAATANNVKSGDYPIQRPFIIATKGEGSAQAQDFMNFIMSAEGQAVIVENNYIAIDEGAPAYKADESAEGKVVVAGSSSVSPVMEKLMEAYAAVNSKVEIELQTSDSSTGISQTIDGVCDIGMASRELKDTELAELEPLTIAIDGIAVIVNNSNPVAGLDKEQVKNIFLGEISNWSEVQ